MSTSSITSSSSESLVFVPPPPPPRILLLRGPVLHRVFEYLNDEEIIAARSCSLLSGEIDVNVVDDVSVYEEMECVSLGDEVPPASGASVSSLPPPPPQQTPPAGRTEEKLTLTVPPGRLGIRLDNTPSKIGTVVYLVSSESPLAGKVFKGDRIVEVNGVNVGRMDTYGTLDVFQRFMNEDRVITIIRSSASAIAYENTPVVKNDGTYLAPAASALVPENCSNKLLNDSTNAEATITERNGNGDGTPPPVEATPAVNNIKVLNQSADTIFEQADADMTLTSFDDERNTSRNSTEGDDLNITAILSNQLKSIMRSNSTPVSTPLPSAESDLMESLDLNSYKSENVAPLTPKDSPDKSCVPRFLVKRQSSEAIPFDELDTQVTLPDFPSNVITSYYHEQHPSSNDEETTTEKQSQFSSPVESELASSVGMDQEYDDDTITSFGSSYFSSVADTKNTDKCEEEKGDFLTQFADAALFGDVTLFTSFVNDLIDSAKHAAKSIVTKRGDPIDDQGPIKIGDNYYTHREAIQKWKKARDKLRDRKYEEGDPKLLRKLENAAMEAAQLMALTKTLDLAARRSQNHMKKKEQKRALKDALKQASLGSSWEAAELEKIHSWEKEKEMKRKKDERDESNFTIHQLINSLSFFGDVPEESDNDEADQDDHEKGEEEVEIELSDHESEEPRSTYEQPKSEGVLPSSSHIPFNSRFALLEHSSQRPSRCLDISMEEDQGDEDTVKVEGGIEAPQYQYLAKSSYMGSNLLLEEEEEEPYDCVAEVVGIDQAPEESDVAKAGSSHKEEDKIEGCSSHAESTEEILDKCNQDNDSYNEMEMELFEALEPSDELRASSPTRSVANPSPAISYTSSFAGTNASSVTELAGCGTKSKVLHLASSVVMSECDYSTSLGSEVSAHDEKITDVNGAEKSMVDGASHASTASSTADRSSSVSVESEAITESKSMTSDAYSGVLSDDTSSKATECSESPERPTGKHMRSQPTFAEDDASNVLVDEMCGLLFTSFEGEESVADNSCAESKVTLDTMLGSQYGTEVVFNAETLTAEAPSSELPQESPVPSTTALRLSSARKPRISSHSPGLVTPSPKGKSSPGIKEVIKSSPLNPMKRIKSAKKSPESDPVSRQSTPEKGEPASLATTPATPSPQRPEKNLKVLPLKMGFGVMRSRSAGV